MTKKQKRTPLSVLGEFRLIDHLTRGIVPGQASTLKGIGDDAAVLKYNGDRLLLVTTDLMTEGIHFNLMYTPLKHLGYKAAVINFSDIYAMNGVPRQMTVSLAVSGKFTVEALEELYEGIRLACKLYGVDFVGGDTSSSLTGMTLTATVIGEVEVDRVVYRSGAGESDLICVSGDLGAAYLGLQILERERKLFETDPKLQPELTGFDYVLERQLKPEARGDVVERLQKERILPTSMMDISDGLSSELIHICKQSGKGCRIYQDKLPVQPETERTAKELQLESLIAVLNGGEDYELVFTVPLSLNDKIQAIEGISLIGHMTHADRGMYMITKDNNEIELTAQGWDAIH